MDFDSDDSQYDPDYRPDNGDGVEMDSSESDSADEISIWNPPHCSRRVWTFSESDMPLLPEIQKRRSARRIDSNIQLDDNSRPSTSAADNAPSTSGTTSSEISELEWLKQKLNSFEWEMPTQDGPPHIEYTIPSSDMKDIYSGILVQADPIDYFDVFMTHDIVEHIVNQTNLYASQYLLTSDVPTNLIQQQQEH
ncbi:hypothetical protein K1T71_012055 [Dendrolimus kikuchii]|uniref:Uncharacterized protein n=1 Tax=Dendrolimus kikuchii TaxID=765133 RepID=A0ACC1CKI9_9NEOP|nr:hypothetical protein K1T71_012055 [Dendrolimus kikuchii]